MPADPVDINRTAENRVRLRFERQTNALTEWQRRECAHDSQIQSRAIEDSVATQATLELEKTRELQSHERAWRQAKDRLAPRPIPAPAFDMMGGPPTRNLVRDHDEMLQRWDTRRDQMVKDFDGRIAGHEAARAEMLQGFAQANQTRDQGHQDDRLSLENRQRESFERLVKKEVERADRWVSPEFNKRGRDDHSNER